jgi:hypothetical protein
VTQLLELDSQTLQSNFGRKAFPVHHTLTDHPLLSVEAVASLADRLPAENVEHNLGNVPDVLPGGEAPKLDLPPGEIARGIDTNGCWMVLKFIEQDPEYRRLLEQSLDEVIPHVADREGGATRKEGFIFLSAPNSTTPSHFDPEHNLLLQIRGPKEFTVGSFLDEETEIREIERYYGGGHRNIEALPMDSETYMLEPGDGVYVPVHAPHSVRTFDDVSVSLSITFYTEATERAADVWAVNSRMRKLRLSPTPPGRRSGVDKLKGGLWGGLRRARNLAGRSGSDSAT